MTNSREVARDALLRIEDGAFAHILVPEMLRATDLDRRDRALVTDLVYGTVRRRRTIDHVLAGASSRPLDTLDPPVRAALRLGTYQLLVGMPPHAAVGETVSTVPDRARGFVNGVLRSLSRSGPPWPLPKGPSIDVIGVRTSHPDWIVQALADEFGADDALATLDLDNQPASVTLRVNRARASVDDVEAQLRETGTTVTRGALVRDALVLEHPGDVGALAPVRDGVATPQDQASQAVVAALDPQSGDRVLDIASAPGGKATGIAERLDGRGVVVAADLHPGRVRTVRRAALRLDLDHMIQPIVADGRHLPLAPGRFDRVLLDAPCSGLGVLRRRPDARWRIRPRDVDDLAVLQREMLAAASEAVRPGGVLVYSVCTLSAAETRGVDAWAASELPELEPLARLAAPWRPHGRGAILLPSDAQTDGMFVLALRRAAGR
jgi:16S rRNA (cytosine967-C5)-methyltransferase